MGKTVGKRMTGRALIVVVIACLICVLGNLCAVETTAQTIEELERMETLNELVQKLPDDSSLNDDDYYCYKQLNSFGKALYWKIVGIANSSFEGETATITIDLEDYKLTYKDIILAVEAAEIDNPYISTFFAVDRNYSLSDEDGGIFTYTMTKRPLSNYQIEKMNARFDQIIKTINYGDAYTKIMNLAQYIQKNIYYDYDAAYLKGGTGTDYAHNLTGPLLYGAAVCEGLSYLIKYVCDRVDIPCLLVFGDYPQDENMSHVWNIIRMEDNQWYWLDATSVSKTIVISPENYQQYLKDSVLKGKNSKEHPSNLSTYGGINAIVYPYDDIAVPELAAEDYVYSGHYDYDSYKEAEFEFVEPERNFLYQVNDDGKSCTITGMDGSSEGDVIIPEEINGLTVTAVGDNAFYSNDRLNGSLVIPDTVTSIGNGAFFKCSGLNGKLTLSKNLEHIGDRAFYECENLEGTLELTKNLNYLGELSFDYCKKLTGNVYISPYINSVHNRFLFTGITSFTVDADNEFLCSVDGAIYSKDLSEFVLCPGGAEHIDILTSVTTIKESALEGCSKLSFDLKELPSNLLTIENYAFQYVSIVGDYSFPDSLQSIGEHVFVSNNPDESLKSLELPKNIRNLGNGAFFSCGVSGEVYIPNSLIKFDFGSLQNGHFITYLCDCDNDQVIEAYNTEAADNWTMRYCNALKLIHKGMPEITEETVFGINGINSVEYQCEICGKKVHDLLSDSPIINQGGCGNSDVNWKVDKKGEMLICGQGEMDGIAYGLINDEIKQSVRTVIIQDGITHIDIGLNGCSLLSTIFIPESINTIDSDAFGNCNELKYVYYEGTEEQWATITNSCFENVTVYCNCQSNVLSHEHPLTKIDAKTASCEAEGNTEYWACSECGKYYSDNNGMIEIEWGSWILPAEEHSWNDGRIIKEANCIEPGSIEYTCISCGKTKTAKIPATGHTPGEVVIENKFDATCETAGSYDEVVYCTVCKEELSRETKAIAATGHIEVIDPAVAPTCTKAGRTAGSHCSVCGEVIKAQEVVPATGHTPAAAVREKEVAATCETAGSYEEVVYCTVCKEELSREKKTIEALGHDWGEWTVVTPATEEAEGLEERVCKNDPEHKETRPIAKLDHVHKLDKVDAKAATCTEAGNIEYWICSGCGHVYKDASATEEVDIKDTVIAATGHTEVIDPSVAPTCTKAGRTAGSHCSVCGEVIKAQEVVPAIGHKWGEWIVSKEATITESGQEVRICENDKSHKETREIPQLPDINKATVDGIKNLSYTGKARTLSLTVTLNGKTLEKGTDYTAKYTNNTNAGTATIIITGKGAYGGSKTLNFTVTKAAVSGVTDPAATTLTYTGKSQKLVTEGTCTGGTIQYSTDNQTWSKTVPTGTKAGSYKVYWKIVGDANHNNKAGGTLTVKIDKAKNPLMIKTSSKSYKRTALTAAKTFTIGAANNQGKVTYTLDTKAKAANIKVSTQGKVTIPKSCKKGTYKITVKAAGNANYKAGSKTVTIVVN